MTEDQSLTFPWFTGGLVEFIKLIPEPHSAEWKSLSNATEDLDAERLLSHLESPTSWFTDRYTQGSRVQLAVTEANIQHVRLFLCHTVLPTYTEVKGTADESKLPDKPDKLADEGKLHICHDLAIPWYATPANLLAFGDALYYVSHEAASEVPPARPVPLAATLVAYHISTYQSAVTYTDSDTSVITKLYYNATRAVVAALLHCPALNWAELKRDTLKTMFGQLMTLSDKCYCITLRHSSTEKDIRLLVLDIQSSKRKDARLAAMQELATLGGIDTSKEALGQSTQDSDAEVRQGNYRYGAMSTKLGAASTPAFQRFAPQRATANKTTFISNGQSRLAFFLPNEHRVDIADQFSGDAPISVHDEYKRYCDSNATDSFEAIDSVLISVRILALATTLAKNNLAQSDHGFVKQMQRTAKLEAPHQQQNELMRLMMRTQIDAGARIQFPAEGFFEPAASRRKAPKLISKLVSNDIPGSHFKRLPTGMLQPVGL